MEERQGYLVILDADICDAATLHPGDHFTHVAERYVFGHRVYTVYWNHQDCPLFSRTNDQDHVDVDTYEQIGAFVDEWHIPGSPSPPHLIKPP